ncbi:MAG: hypothetical protein QXI58_05115 [Candidatus Micrarchaeia archaeon]
MKPYNIIKYSIAIVIFFIFALFNIRISGPAYLSDEIGYLGHAIMLAGYHIDAASSWHAGYSIMLSPFFRISLPPEVIWLCIIFFNAFLWGIIVLFLFYLLDYMFPGFSIFRKVVAIIVTISYPTWIVMSGYAFATTAFVFFFLITFVLVTLLDFSRAKSVIPHSVALGYLYWIHPTGLAVIFASLFAMAVICFKKRHYHVLLLHFLILFCMIIFYNKIHEMLVYSSTTIANSPPRLHYNYSYTLLVALSSLPHIWYESLISLIGKLFYLSISSFGVVVIGLTYLSKLFLQHLKKIIIGGEKQDEKIFYLSALSLISFIIILFGTSISPNFKRLDYYIYGRYLEHVLILPILLGFMLSYKKRFLFFIILVPILFGIWLDYYAIDTNAYNKYNNIVNTISFWPQYLYEPNFVFWAIFGSAGMGIFHLLREYKKIGLILSILFIFLIYFTSDLRALEFHEKILAGYSKPSEIVEIVRKNFPSGTCIGFDTYSSNYKKSNLLQKERFHLYKFYFYNYNYSRMQIEDWLSNCNGLLLTYNSTFILNNKETLTLLAQEVRTGLYLVSKRLEKDVILPENPEEVYLVRNGSIVYELKVYGDRLKKDVFSKVGKYTDRGICSENKSGVLIYGPYFSLGPGNYVLIVKGSIERIFSAYVDVVSNRGATQHAKFLISGNASGIISMGFVKIDDFVKDLEIRVFVSERDIICLEGYELVPVENENIPYLLILYGDQILGIASKFSKTGELQEDGIFSTNERGFLIFGPYITVPPGDYVLVVWGISKFANLSFVDIVSNGGSVQHAKFFIKETNGQEGILVNETLKLENYTKDLEIRLYVERGEFIYLKGYKLLRKV